MIHTQSNAVVTSKIRARKTPKLIRSRVLSNAIAGKPVPQRYGKNPPLRAIFITSGPTANLHLFVHLFVENARISLYIFICSA